MIKKNYFIMLLTIGLTSIFTSCKKDSESEFDKLKKEYADMQADSTQRAKDVKQLTDVELAQPTTQDGLKDEFWMRSIPGTAAVDQPKTFADSVAGNGPNGKVYLGYVKAPPAIITQYGPNGTNELTAESITLLNNISGKSQTYLNILPLIEEKRAELFTK